MQPAVLDNTLWQSILGFNFDDAEGDYCFSVRLAQEQGWTEHFTEQAILEYRRFMYLAATEKVMVSPSPIVDEVWHLHLLFTESYRRFCRLLEKEIAHIPSTHSQKEASKFKEAKEQTARAYEKVFGPMPAAIWEAETMEAGLGLTRKGPGLGRLVLIGCLGLSLLVPFLFWMLKPLYAAINNPYFLIGYGVLVVLVFRILQQVNRVLFQQMVAQFPPTTFPFHLTPSEGIYLKGEKPAAVVDNIVNRLIQKQVVGVLDNKELELQQRDLLPAGKEETVVALLEEQGPLKYSVLLRQLLLKPIFLNTQNGSKVLQKAIKESCRFTEIFALNFCLLGIVFLLGLTRICTGVARHKPVLFLVIIMVIVFFAIAGYLLRLTKFANMVTLPEKYQEALIPETAKPEWDYFLLGSAALALSFAPMAQSAGYRNNSISSDSGGSSCSSDSGGGSSCGSSCGSGCGGCGGGD